MNSPFWIGTAIATILFCSKILEYIAVCQHKKGKNLKKDGFFFKYFTLLEEGFGFTYSFCIFFASSIVAMLSAERYLGNYTFLIIIPFFIEVIIWAIIEDETEHKCFLMNI